MLTRSSFLEIYCIYSLVLRSSRYIHGHRVMHCILSHVINCILDTEKLLIQHFPPGRFSTCLQKYSVDIHYQLSGILSIRQFPLRFFFSTYGKYPYVNILSFFNSHLEASSSHIKNKGKIWWLHVRTVGGNGDPLPPTVLIWSHQIRGNCRINKILNNW